VEAGGADEAARRGVERFFKFSDPAGVPLELFVKPELAPTPFQSEKVHSGFVTGELGLGHAVISAKDQSVSERFYTELLGFRLSDHIRGEFHGYKVDLAFFHANRRHHSIAFGGPQRHRIHHFMLEVRALDDVGLAFDRALRKGVRIMQTLGRHPNDRMFSFYAKTPSGFQFEYGWGGREIDDASWQPTTYDRISEWGHHPPQVVFGEPRSR
jgi:2,3-dihydroxybiphenyl 1,2-dioxygenase